MSSISNDRLKDIAQFIGIPHTKLQGLPKDTLENAVTGFENARHALRLDSDVQPKLAKLSLNVTTFSSADLTVSITGFADLAPSPVKVTGFGSVGSRSDIEGALSFKPGVSTNDFLTNANTAYVTVASDGTGTTTVQFYDNSNGAGLTGDNYKGAFYGSGSGTGDFTGTATGVNWSSQSPTPIAPKQGSATITITSQSAATIALDVAKFAKTSQDAAVTGTGSNGKRSGDGSLVITSGISDDTFIANTTTANVSLDVSGNLLVTFYDAKSVVTGTFSQSALKGTGNFNGWATSLTWTRQY